MSEIKKLKEDKQKLESDIKTLIDDFASQYSGIGIDITTELYFVKAALSKEKEIYRKYDKCKINDIIDW